MESIPVDFVFWAAMFAFISPLIVSGLKNIGGQWPLGLKQLTAGVMAVVGSVIAFGVTAGWSSIVLNDFVGFWQPLLIGVAGIFSAQYASYMAIWRDTKALAFSEKLGIPTG